MRKFTAVLFVSMLCSFATAANATVTPTLVTEVPTPAAIYYPNETNRLIFQFDVTPTGSDTLKAVAMQNVSIAPTSYILDYKLWQDNGNSLFDESFADSLIGSANQNSNNSSIFWSDLNISLSAKTRFYVSIETSSNNVITTSKPITYKIFFEDLNDDGIFDFQNDFGVFMASKQVGPAENAILLSDTITISNSSIDQSNPIGLITSPNNGDLLLGKSFTVTGKTKDQGGGNVQTASLIIDGQAKAIETTNGFATWTYAWENVTAGNHTIALLVTDTNNNTNSAADTVTFTVDNAIFSANHTITRIDKNAAISDGIDHISINVTLKDSSDAPISDKMVTLEWADEKKPDSVQNPATDSFGNVSIVLKSGTPVQTSVKISYQGTVLATYPVSFAYLASQQPLVVGVPANSGDLIKASGQAVYYLGANGKRFVFPDDKTYFTWYPDFSTVKTITDAQLQLVPLGGNVTYRPGTKLVKITTDPKVYAVDAHGGLRWLETEATANAIFGSNWGSLVQDVPDGFFVNYTVGASIKSATDYNLTLVREVASSINIDKAL